MKKLANLASGITLSIAQGSVVDFEGDAIVNAANNLCLGGGGVDGAISNKGGEALQRARRALPLVAHQTRVRTGDAVITIAGKLNSRFVVHAVGPDFRSTTLAEKKEGLLDLSSAYKRSLSVAAAQQADPPIRSIAFSLLSAGIFRGDLSLAKVLSIGFDAVEEWARDSQDHERGEIDHVIFVGFTDQEWQTLDRCWAARPLPLVPSVSGRSDTFLVGHKLPYVGRFFAALQDQYHPETNPGGKLAMAVAENKLAQPLLAEKLAAFPGFSPAVFNYTASTGSPQLKTTLCSFLNAFVFKDCAVTPEQIVVAPGCCALLHQLAFLLFEPGDSVLVPTPYYPAFDHDFLNLGRVRVVEVNCSQEPSMELTEAGLDAAFALANERESPSKALLLTNPSNPLGTIYTPEQLQLAIAWTARHGLHLIVDEIYALSVFGHLGADGSPSPASADYPWASAASMLARAGRGLGEHVHVMWSLSKDLGASGFRLGCLYTHSAPLLRALGSMTDMFQVSNLAQELVAHALADHAWLGEYLGEARRRTKASYELLRQGLAALPIPLQLVSAQGAIFAFVDFRPLLVAFAAITAGDEAGAGGDAWAAEEALGAALFDKIGLVLTPGRSCHCQLPGFFRCCYAWVQPEAVSEMLRRLSGFQGDVLAAQRELASRPASQPAETAAAAAQQSPPDE